MTDFILPEIGEGIETVSITEILVNKNDSIKENDPILLVETDKASMEIPINQDCIIKNILVNVGDLISPGQKILEIEAGNNIENDKIDLNENNSINDKENITDDFSKKEINIESESLNQTNHSNTLKSESKSHASPSIRKLAREMDCDINNIKGSGENNRITKEDIYNSMKSENLDIPLNKIKKTNLFNNLAKWGLVEEIKLNSIRKTSAKRLTQSWNTIPHVTQFEEVDITQLDKVVKLLKKVNKDKNAKVSYIPFFIKAVSIILSKLPIFNSSFNSDNNSSIIQKHYYNIGVAVDTEHGLVVPVIKNVDKKSIKNISIELSKIIDKAKKGKLTLDEMSGGSITISSLGNIGGSYFTPIINSPEAAILGISKIIIKPIYENNKFVAKKMLPISLSYDHRVVNGADAAKFTNLFSELISNPSKI